MVVLLVAAVFGCSPSEEASTPLPAELEGWAAGPSSEFVGDELFMWINGGAEIYHEYGFASVEVREYERGEDRISAEIYTMDGEAFGIYSWARSETGQPVDMGAGGTLADYYLHFWSGPHLVVLTAQNPDSDPQAALDLGRRISTHFPQEGALPELMDLLPVTCESGTATYFVGPIAFNNLVPTMAPWFSGFQEGVTGHCQTSTGDPVRLILLRWVTAQLASDALGAAADRIGATAGLLFAPVEDGVFSLASESGLVAIGQRSHRVIQIALTAGEGLTLDDFPSTTQDGGEYE